MKDFLDKHGLLIFHIFLWGSIQATYLIFGENNYSQTSYFMFGFLSIMMILRDKKYIKS